VMAHAAAPLHVAQTTGLEITASNLVPDRTAVLHLGAAACAVFYFLLRYPGTISAAQLPPDRLDVLGAWHDLDPVSGWERHRNAAIYARQGNRNPFIDHPEWAAEAVPHLHERRL
jgi:endonuclease I